MLDDPSIICLETRSAERISQRAFHLYNANPNARFAEPPFVTVYALQSDL